VLVSSHREEYLYVNNTAGILTNHLLLNLRTNSSINATKDYQPVSRQAAIDEFLERYIINGIRDRIN